MRQLLSPNFNGRERKKSLPATKQKLVSISNMMRLGWKEATLTASLAHAGSIINNLQVRWVKSRWGKRYFNTYYRCSVVVHGVNCIKSASWIRVGGKLVGCEMKILLVQPDFYYWRCSEAQSYQYCELRVAVPYRRVPDTNIIINICYIHWRRLHQGCRFRPGLLAQVVFRLEKKRLTCNRFFICPLSRLE